MDECGEDVSARCKVQKAKSKSRGQVRHDDDVTMFRAISLSVQRAKSKEQGARALALREIDHLSHVQRAKSKEQGARAHTQSPGP